MSERAAYICTENGSTRDINTPVKLKLFVFRPYLVVKIPPFQSLVLIVEVLC